MIFVEKYFKYKTGKMSRLKKLIQTFVLNTNELPVFKELYLAFYKISLKIIVKRLSCFPEVKCIYLKGSMAAGLNNLRPGASDIDLLVILRILSADEELKFLTNFWKQCSQLRKLFPQLNGHIKVISEENMDEYILLETFISSSKFYNNSRKCQKVYGPDEINFGKLDSVIKETSKELLKLIFLSSNYLELLRGFYNLNYSVHPSQYTSPLFAILGDEKIKRLKFSRQLNETYIVQSLSCAIASVDISCKNYLEYIDDKHQEIELRHTDYNFKPETCGYAIDLIKPFAQEMYEKTKGSIDAVILSSEIGSNYSYILFVVLKEGLKSDSFIEVVANIRKIYANNMKLPKEYFPMYWGFPIILTRNMLNSLPYVVSSINYFYLIKHGMTLCGKNIIQDLNKVSSISRLNIALYVAGIKCLLNKQWEKVSASMDMVYGILPAIRLILDKKIITTTPKEAFKEYYKSYAHEKETEGLIRYYERQQISPEHMPVCNQDDIYKAYTFGKYCLEAINTKINKE